MLSGCAGFGIASIGDDPTDDAAVERREHADPLSTSKTGRAESRLRGAGMQQSTVRTPAPADRARHTPTRPVHDRRRPRLPADAAGGGASRPR